ncbi:hypothetical protein M8C21_023519 [Ambrosia artemisiifolia]|uniref:Uncharacterized protein n=1 Tax=Ambrosia artemisiifolia TaxID=4212 RepID=A0AAD5CFI1_AMBAR|nr:hypothetical protein M8C21_023519 [Ambrosia artemisiifolia]
MMRSVDQQQMAIDLLKLKSVLQQQEISNRQNSRSAADCRSNMCF